MVDTKKGKIIQDREYKSSKESSDTTSKTDTDGVPK